MFSANQKPTAQQKDTVRNTEATGKFCWNLATWDLREAVSATAEQTEYGVDEFERAGLAKIDSKLNEVSVNGGARKIPMVRDSPVKFECEYYTTLRLPGNSTVGSVDVVIGKVVGIHIDERVLTDGKIDIQKTGELILRLANSVREANIASTDCAVWIFRVRKGHGGVRHEGPRVIGGHYGGLGGEHEKDPSDHDS